MHINMLKPDTDLHLPLLRPTLGKQEWSPVRAEIVLGSPSADCSGLGLCKMMTMKPTGVRYKCPVVSAWLSLNYERRLRIHFLKDSMELRFMWRHFRWFLFQVVEPYRVPDELLRSLSGLSEPVVRPGIYTVWETSEHLIVDF